MNKFALTTLAALPGTGAGCVSALRAEVHKAPAPKTAPEPKQGPQQGMLDGVFCGGVGVVLTKDWKFVWEAHKAGHRVTLVGDGTWEVHSKSKKLSPEARQLWKDALHTNG